MLKILLLDERQESRADLAMSLMHAGFIVAVATGSQSAQEKLHQMEFDWLICGQEAPGGEVDDFLEIVRGEEIHADVLNLLLLCEDLPSPHPDTWPLLSAHHKPPSLKGEDVVRFLLQPEPEPAKLTAILPEPTMAGPLMIGGSANIQKVSRLIARIAQTDSTVLITGESGTGKELAAQSLHLQSPRANNNMVPINCGAIPEDLLESELFGHTKGAFTGATSHRKGRLALAQGGTLFLDEIGEMPLNLQVKLLRVLQEQTYTPLGSEKEVQADVRIVAATNQDLKTLIEQKTFREDLYYRLNVIPIHLPPLRERPSDIPELIHHFLRTFNERFASAVEGLTDEAMSAVLAYEWPGNIRELRNIVERMVILNEAPVLDIPDLPDHIQELAGVIPTFLEGAPGEQGPVLLPEEGLHFYDAVEQFEKSLIRQALDRTDWNKNKAAMLLNMNRTTLVEKIKKRAIERDKPDTKG